MTEHQQLRLLSVVEYFMQFESGRTEEFPARLGLVSPDALCSFCQSPATVPHGPKCVLGEASLLLAEIRDLSKGKKKREFADVLRRMGELQAMMTGDDDEDARLIDAMGQSMAAYFKLSIARLPKREAPPEVKQ